MTDALSEAPQFGIARILSDGRFEVPALNSANEVRHVLDVLKIPVTEFSKYIGVSRQAVYDWLRGKQIGAVNAAKVENFVRAADVIAASDIQMSPLNRGRKLVGGETLFQSIAAGAEGDKAALALVEMLRDEASRRDELTARFRGRAQCPRSRPWRSSPP